MSTRQRVTSGDIASRVGVSRATVSAVLNGAQGTIRVSELTRKRILDVAAELGYSPNPVARALRRGQSGSIAFVPRPRPAEHGHFLTYLVGLNVARSAARRGYHSVEISPETAAGTAADDLIEFLLGRRPDGVIFDAPPSADDVQRVVAEGIPVVQVLRPLADVPTATVTVDPSRGIAAAVDHLVELGHRRIAYLANGDGHPVERQRFAAFTTSLTDHGLTLPETAIALAGDYAIEEGRRLTHQLLAVAPRPTAIFAASDVLAAGTMRALYEARIRVPDEMSVVGYDDTHAEMLYPPVSAVAQPLEGVGEQALALIMRLLDAALGNGAEPEHAVLPTHFNPRASTGAPPQE